jgi:hypothetical protein
MAITDAYVTPQDYIAVKGTGGDGDAVRLDADLSAVSRFLERKLGDFWNRDAAAVARVYVPGTDGSGHALDYLRVASIGDPAGVTIKVDTDRDGSFADETAWDAGDFVLRRDGDLNYALGPEAKPANEIWIPDWSTQTHYWQPGYGVEVTTKWGWPAVPAAITQAVIELTAILQVRSPRATNRYNDMDNVITMTREGRSIVAELMSVYGPGVVVA